MNSNTLKPLFNISDNTGCGFYRILAPVSALKRYGIDARVTDLAGDAIRKNDENICIIQRQYLPEAFEILLMKRSCGIPVVSELDDNFWNIPKENYSNIAYDSIKLQERQAIAKQKGELGENEFYLDNKKWLTEFIRMSDAVTVSTYSLAQVVRSINPNVFVIPNYLADDLFYFIKPPSKIKQGDKIRIFWSGSPTHTGDLPYAFEALTNLQRKYPVKLVILGQPPITLSPEWILGENLEIHPPILPVPSYYYLLQWIPAHIAIAPLAYNSFNACKSWIKGLEYGMSGYCPLLQKYHPYTSLKYEIGMDIPLVDKNTTFSWEKALESLINNPDKVFQTAVEVQQRVIKNFGMLGHIKEHIDIYKRIQNLKPNTYMPKSLPKRAIKQGK